MMQKIEITVLSGVSRGDIFRFDLEPKSAVTVGRGSECQLVLQDPMVSRNHASIELRNEGFFLTDLGSSHGTVHMGFQLEKGAQAGRRLSDFDEFKVGESIFRVNFSEDAFAPPSAEENTNGAKSTTGTGIGVVATSVFRRLKKKTKRTHVIMGVLLIAALVGFLVTTSKKSGGLPAQHGHIAMNMPQYRVIGYWQGGKAKELVDVRHLDKAQFELPSSDVLIEYDIRSEAPIKIAIDEVVITTIPPEPALWQHRSLIIRDVASGVERKLIFDNTEFPRPQNAPGRNKRWAIRNIRATPLSRPISSSFASRLDEAIGRAGAVETTASGLFMLVRSIQRTLLEVLVEERIDALDVGLSLESRFPPSYEMKNQLESIKREREEGTDLEIAQRHMTVLAELLTKTDSELWRRVSSRFREAESKVEVKAWIDAHDTLSAVREMFPDEDDHRWEIANDMFNDNKVVPKKVRENPGKYRK